MHTMNIPAVANTLLRETKCFHLTRKTSLESMGSLSLTKVFFSAYDDKRFIQDDGITSCAYGHYATPSCAKQVENLEAVMEHNEW